MYPLWLSAAPKLITSAHAPLLPAHSMTVPLAAPGPALPDGPAGPMPAISAGPGSVSVADQVRPPSVVRQIFPGVARNPSRESLKHAVWTLAGAVATTCQVRPPSSVRNSRPPSWTAGYPPSRATVIPPQTAKPRSADTKCTDLAALQGSVTGAQAWPPSVVASRVFSPTAQPCSASVKSSSSRLAGPLYWVVHDCPP